MKAHAWLLVVAVVAAVAAGGCRSGDDERPEAGQTCTLIGCDSGLVVTVTDLNRAYPEATEILACYQEECVRGEPRQGGAQVLIPKRLKEPRDLRVTLTILGRKEVFARSTTVARLEPSFPNGRECDRGCVNGRITYQATNDRWVER